MIAQKEVKFKIYATQRNIEGTLKKPQLDEMAKLFAK